MSNGQVNKCDASCIPLEKMVDLLPYCPHIDSDGDGLVSNRERFSCFEQHAISTQKVVFDKYLNCQPFDELTAFQDVDDIFNAALNKCESMGLAASGCPPTMNSYINLCKTVLAKVDVTGGAPTGINFSNASSGLVVSIDQDRSAARSGIQPGDYITAIDGTPFEKIDYPKSLKLIGPCNVPVTIEIYRPPALEGMETYLDLPTDYGYHTYTLTRATR